MIILHKNLRKQTFTKERSTKAILNKGFGGILKLIQFMKTLSKLHKLTNIILYLVLTLQLFSCHSGNEFIREYTKEDGLFLININIKNLDTISPVQAWVEIIDVLPALGPCDSINYADYYLCIADRQDTVQVISPCEKFVHNKNNSGDLFSYDTVIINNISINYRTKLYNYKYKTIIGKIIMPIE